MNNEMNEILIPVRITDRNTGDYIVQWMTAEFADVLVRAVTDDVELMRKYRIKTDC